MSLCIVAGSAGIMLAWSAFTLSWTHSVEKIEWQEDWQIVDGALMVVEARVQGTGAGMEPPADARFAGGWWHYRPQIGPLPSLTLARSGATGDWRLCSGADCVDLAGLTGGASGTVSLLPCGGG